jgi:hypothetical protein
MWVGLKTALARHDGHLAQPRQEPGSKLGELPLHSAERSDFMSDDGHGARLIRPPSGSPLRPPDARA